MAERTSTPGTDRYSSTVRRMSGAPENRMIFTHSVASDLTTFDLTGNTQNLLNIGFYAGSIDSTYAVTVYDGDSTGTVIGSNIPVITLPNYQMDFGEGGLVIANGSVTVNPSESMNVTLQYVYDN